MRTQALGWIALLSFAIAQWSARFALAQAEVALPADVKAVWELSKAWKETTPSKERICINGLWRWQPADEKLAPEKADASPAGGWGWFKVPGSWPGITDYLESDSQTLYAHPSWKTTKISAVKAAWYQREITIPADWANRRVTLATEYINSVATIFIDGKKIGELHFPAGELDLSAACKPGQKYTLSILVNALPLKAVMTRYIDTAVGREVKGSVPRRGLCGDVYLIGAPPAARVEEVKVATSFRRGEISIDSALSSRPPDGPFTLRAQITQAGKRIESFDSPPFKSADAAAGHFAFTHQWKPDRLWDLHTPANNYDIQVSLIDTAGKTLDISFASRFGYREFWIEGKDFYLNGSRIFLSAVPIVSAQIGAAASNYTAAKDMFTRLKAIGVNFVYTGNYECEPGSHQAFEEILRAADDTGVLVALTQPHFSQYDWKKPDADATNGYAQHAAFYAHVAGNHPSIVFYSTSHNATGYSEDMNPDMIGGVEPAREAWGANNAKLAFRAEAIIRKFDPTRIVYHHAGGNIGAMHTSNFYPNFAPIQELSDWFTQWSQSGLKPMFTCEYAAPFTWDWTMYRGWYKGQRAFGSGEVPWELCLSEWNSQFLGDAAMNIGDLEKRDLRWEAAQFKAGKVWHRWDYPVEVGSARFEDRQTIIGQYLADNWRAFRTLGVSGISAWNHGNYWLTRAGVDKSRKELKTDWDNLQRPGISPDYLDRQFEQVELTYSPADWIPTDAGKALLRNNQPILAYIGGKADAVTEKTHLYQAGEAVEKQIVLVNNSRQSQSFECAWTFTSPQPAMGQKTITVETGQISFLPLRINLPANLPAGRYELKMTARFGQNQEQSDTFAIDVRPAPAPLPAIPAVALFDPGRQTASLLEKLSIPFKRIEADADLSAFDTLVIGKLALTPTSPAPDVSRVRDGLKVICFEQSSEVLEKRLGFRVVEYGLRQVFPRQPDHPLLAGLDPQYLHDWRGQSTTLPPRLKYEMRLMYGPTIMWCDIPVTRVWRCGMRGAVASVLIEKPARGDFRPILDGGYSLQYSPLIEFREGKGLILFCQMDVTGRSEADPAAQLLAANLFRYAAAFKPDPIRQAVYLGEPAGKKHLESAGFTLAPFDPAKFTPDQVLILSPGASKELALNAAPAAPANPTAPAIAAILKFLQSAGRTLALGLDQRDADLLALNITIKKSEHISATFAPPTLHSPLAGIGPADVFNRGPREIPLVTAGATIFGDGVLATAASSVDAPALAPNIAFFELLPWQLDYSKSYNLKRTYRRSAFALTRILANMGVPSSTPTLDRLHTPTAPTEKRFLNGLYLDQPEEWDDPYRFFRW